MEIFLILLGLAICIIFIIWLIGQNRLVEEFNSLTCPDCNNSFGRATLFTKIKTEEIHVNFGEHGSSHCTVFLAWCNHCDRAQRVNLTDLSHITNKIDKEKKS